MYADTLKLIVTGDRRHPSPRLPERLNGLFRSLGDASGGRAERIEDEIWRLWMAYRIPRPRSTWDGRRALSRHSIFPRARASSRGSSPLTRVSPKPGTKRRPSIT